MCEVYVIVASCGHVKIGITDDVPKRLAGLQTSNPLPLRLYTSVRASDRKTARLVESSCHSLLALYRVCGEWFSVIPQIAELALFSIVDTTICSSYGRGAMALYRDIAGNPKIKIPQTIINQIPGLMRQEASCQ